VALNFLLDLETAGRDFRQTRLQRLVVHLVGFMALLDETSIEPSLMEARKRWATTHAL
jgi:hypothetical protein